MGITKKPASEAFKSISYYSLAAHWHSHLRFFEVSAAYFTYTDVVKMLQYFRYLHVTKL